MTFWYIFNSIGETRGIGGIFFDDLDKEPQSDCYNFVQVSFKTEKIDTVKKNKKYRLMKFMYMYFVWNAAYTHSACIFLPALTFI